MKLFKKGFTLSEVLVTLSIIGVVAALSAPMLISGVSNAMVYPKLLKFKTTFENASGLMLADRNSDSVLRIGSIARAGHHMTGAKTEAFMDLLQNYMKVSEADWYAITHPDGRIPMEITNREEHKGESGDFSRHYCTDDGMCFWIHITQIQAVTESFANIPSHQPIGQVHLDINGRKDPNITSKDVFWFGIYNDGTLRPTGSHDNLFVAAAQEEPDYNRTWKGGNCDENSVNAYHMCAGSIFDNGKVIYKR